MSTGNNPTILLLLYFSIGEFCKTFILYESILTYSFHSFVFFLAFVCRNTHSIMSTISNSVYPCMQLKMLVWCDKYIVFGFFNLK